MYHEHKKLDGSLPLVVVNTILPKEHAGNIVTEFDLIRSTSDEMGGRSTTSRLTSSCATFLSIY